MLQATAISRDGLVVVGFHGGGTHNRAFRWTVGKKMVDLGQLQTTDTTIRANGTNQDGSVIVGYSQTFAAGAPIRAFRWTASSGMEDLGVPAGSSQVDALAVSADGKVVVGDFYDSQMSTFAFRWTEATGIVSIAPGYATWTNANGSMVIGFTTNQGSFRWTAELGPTFLMPVTPGLTARASNAKGSIIVGQGNDYRAFRWTETSGFAALGEPPGDSVSDAVGTSDDGSIIAGMSSSSSIRATVWDQEKGPRFVSDLLTEAGVDMNGWTLNGAVGISADGKVVAGNGVSPQHVYEAWVARLP